MTLLKNGYPQIPILIFCLVSVIPLYIHLNSHYSWAGWTRSTCYPHCYCEAPSGGPIEQISNSFSNLLYVLAGLLIALLPHSKKRAELNLISSDPSYSILYGCNTIILGFGSFFYHGSLTEFGRFFDWFGMYLFASYIIIYSIARYFRSWFTPARFLTIFSLFMVALVIITLTVNADIRRHIFTVMIIIALIVAGIVNLQLQQKLNSWYLAASLTSLVIAYGIWNLDNNGIYCFPHSLIQGHAIWHILTGLSISLVYLYLRSETPPDYIGPSKFTV